MDRKSEKISVPDASCLICASPTDLMHPLDSHNSESPLKWPLNDLIWPDGPSWNNQQLHPSQTQIEK